MPVDHINIQHPERRGVESDTYRSRLKTRPAQERVKLRIGDHEIIVTREDAALLERDMRLFGNHYLHVDGLTMEGRRVNPAQVTLTKPARQGC